MQQIENIFKKRNFSKKDLIYLLSLSEKEAEKLFAKALEIKQKYVGKQVYFRGIIEFSNICQKNCFYCGIRKSNKNVKRFFLSEKQIIDIALQAYDNGLTSIVLQSGEIQSKFFAKKMEKIIKRIKQLSNDKIGITLSLGEQNFETYQRWFEAGAHRYLLRIEVSNPKLYPLYHPKNHSYERRLKALRDLQQIGYQTGSGVMIGLPFQTTEDLAEDLLFFKKFDFDMIGMGPYVEHRETPLYKCKNLLKSKKERFFLSLKMIAVLRILMKDINIASTTALDTLDKDGRKKGILAGANVLMPNISPEIAKKNYYLYHKKNILSNNVDNLKKKILEANHIPILDKWGDSKHFFKKIQMEK